MTATLERPRKKRERQVYSDDMVAHLWANQSQAAARNARENLYFEGDTIYSYGGHFPIARIVDGRKGKCVLFTSRSYSPTTAGHKCQVKRAIAGHVTIFTVQDVTAHRQCEHITNFEAIKADMMATATKAAKARVNAAFLWQTVARLEQEANAYAERFGVRRKAVAPGNKEEVAAQLERNRIANARAKAKADKVAAVRNAEMMERAQEDLIEWRRHVVVGGYRYCLSLLPCAVRLSADKEHFETSHGAEVPYKDGLRLLKIVRAMIAHGKTYTHTNHSMRVGSFVVNKIDAQEVVIGCHSIAVTELENLAKKIGE